MVFFNALGGVLSLLLVVCLGYALAARGLIPAGARQWLPKLVTNITLPPFLACTIISSLPRDDLLHVIYGALAPLITMLALFGLAFLAGKLIGVEKRHFGLFCVCVSNPNTIFIGIPINLALFGRESLAYVLLYYFASTSIFWTIGNYFIARDAPRQRSSAFGWRKIFSAPLMGFLFGLLVIFSGLPIPEFIFRAAMLTGEMTTPLALIFIGIILQASDLKKLRLSRDMGVALIGRMVVSPLLMLAILAFFELPELMRQVFIIQSALPVVLQVAILSAYYDTDAEFGSLMVTLSTICCVITVPLCMALI